MYTCMWEQLFVPVKKKKRGCGDGYVDLVGHVFCIFYTKTKWRDQEKE